MKTLQVLHATISLPVRCDHILLHRLVSRTIGLVAIVAANHFGMAAHAQTQAPSNSLPTSAAKEEAVVLNPFEVIADPSDTYQALNTSSLTGTNRSLERLPITAEVFNETMLRDVGVSEITSLLSNHFTGIGGGENGEGTTSPQGTQGGDRVNMQGYRIRGLTAFPRRNGFVYLGDIPDSFSYERVEVIRGPQSLLYGNNPAGGVINTTTKKAHFGKSYYNLEFKTDSFDSLRFQLDANIAGTIARRRVAARFALLESDTKFWNDIAQQETRGGYLEAAAEIFPASSTVVRVEFEDRNRFSLQGRRQTLVSGLPSAFPNNTALEVLLAQNSPALANIAGGRINWRNVNSLAGNSFTQTRWEQFKTISVSSRLNSWLDAQLMAIGTRASNDQTTANGFTGLLAPLSGGNPLNAWAVGYRPGGSEVKAEGWGIRGTMNARFTVKKLVSNELIVGYEKARPRKGNSNFSYNYYELNGSGAFIVDPSQINTTNRGRNLIPIQWVDVSTNATGFMSKDRAPTYTVGGKTYAWDYTKIAGSVPPASGNPLGFNAGVAGATMTSSETEGLFAALFSTWFAGKVDTLLGVRRDDLLQQTISSGEVVTGSGTTGNAGLVWNVSGPFSIYVGTSSNFTPGGVNFQSRYDGTSLPNGRGESVEGGIKINARDGRVSGSLTYFETRSKNQIVQLDGATQQVMAPNGINGNYWSTITRGSYNYDAATKGLEVTLSGRPTKALRLMGGYSLSAGREGSAVVLPFYYNDEFKANAQGQILLADGTPLRVPVNAANRVAADGKTYAANVATQILTVDMMKVGDANGNYRASLSPENGRILNAAQLGLTVPGVGTGRLGLPISSHQLGFVPPTDGVKVRAGGERTSGFPRHSVTFTAMYELPGDRLRGLSAGVNLRADWDTILYYYNDAAAGNVRRAFHGSDQLTVNPSVRYQRRIGAKLQWITQINVYNAFDERSVLLFPNLANGRPDNAGYRVDGRSWAWTNSFRF